MTKMLRVFAAFLIILSLMGCGAKKDNEAKNDATNTDTETNVNDGATDDSTNDASNNSATDTNANNEGNHELTVADDVADKIVEMEEVESANVIVTDENAYVAVVLKEGKDDSEEIENKIADQARTANTDFKNVYVSMNPDFVKQINDYGNKIKADEPVEGFFEEFSDAMKRVFPDAH
ncbi:MAG TPA: YhcN/YlaJ family sporulation lipoprotein [Sporosarcina psychrophila]|uniref:YhcN/YlaJ family sporulation lipoprotein n=1 Tax=Sporosarcina psychrophila TaxID=1476 RepID=A0A921G0Y0_SPOPS|nr:YhcN/YlaJ family sporulation lipoprotein [Sporosarcina psychrophila]